MPAGWTPPVDRRRRRLHDVEPRRRLRARGRGSRSRASRALAGPDRRHHVRLAAGPRPRRRPRRADVAVRRGVDGRRRDHADRRPAGGHGLRARRRRGGGDADDERLRVADGQHGHVHVYGGDGRHVGRRRQADDPGGLDGAFDRRRTTPATRRRAPARSRSRAGRDGCEPDASGRLDVHDHVRRHERRRPGRDGDGDHRRADVAGPGQGDGRRRLHEHRLPRRRSRSTPRTAPGRSPRAPAQRLGARRPDGRSRSRTPRPPAAWSAARSRSPRRRAGARRRRRRPIPATRPRRPASSRSRARRSRSAASRSPAARR